MICAPKRSFAIPRSLRLTRSSDFSRVFEKAIRSRDQFFTILARPNSRNIPRLGLAISKKCAANAVNRHRVKRLLRESFRINQYMLPAVDIVVMCRPKICSLNNQQIFKTLDHHWRKIRIKCEAC